MARQTTSLEVNTFIQGLITEASPLTFPENASIDEDNFVLLRDGSRRRRLGMDFEEGHQVVETEENGLASADFALTTYNWKNAGGRADREILVVQTGTTLKFFDLALSVLSSAEIFSTQIAQADPSQIFSFSSVDGRLVCVTGRRPVVIFEYQSGEVSQSEKSLKIRDFFGVEATYEGDNIREGNNVSIRPSTLSEEHTYNLRNQSWGPPRERNGSSRALDDTIQRFNNVVGQYPSNADTVNQALYPDPSQSENRTGDMFFPRDLENNPIGNMHSANGFFIIDALQRGPSRVDEASKLYSQYSQLTFPIENLPADTTPGGATCVAEFAGRVWYGGFSGEVQDGDSASPRMSSYLLFSTLVQNSEDIIACYQDGDPTSKDAPDLIDTDGGFLRIDGAYRIQDVVAVGKVLMVIAQNGVWMVTGGSDFGFTANNVLVSKIHDKGADAPGSVVVVDNTVVFWADDAIYHIKQNEFGDWQAENLTQSTIQKFYESISPLDKLYCQGRFDSYDNKIRWVYQNRLGTDRPVRELILDVSLGAFYTSTIQSVEDNLPRVAAPVLVPPFLLDSTASPVTYDGTLVTYNGDAVTYTESVTGEATKETIYLTLLSANPVTYTFSLYRDTAFRDWRTLDGVGTDAEAFLITGWNGGGDFLRHKQVPYIAFHFLRTEDGFTEGAGGNLFPTSQSSCIVQAQWDWNNSPANGRWGREFEAYRYRRLYSPSGASDPFDSGELVITSRNKLRGKGRVLSLYIRTSPDRDCQLLGWSMIMGVTGGI